MMIKGLGGVTIPLEAGRAGRSGPAFSVAGNANAAAPSKACATATLDGLLLLQEATDAPARDRRARQHGRALLDALGRLQLGLLSDGPDDSAAQTLGQLESLAETCPEASDPALKGTLDAIVLRVRVELARQQL